MIGFFFPAYLTTRASLCTFCAAGPDMNSAELDVGGAAAVLLYRTAARRAVPLAASDLHAVVRSMAGMVVTFLQNRTSPHNVSSQKCPSRRDSLRSHAAIFIGSARRLWMIQHTAGRPWELATASRVSTGSPAVRIDYPSYKQ